MTYGQWVKRKKNRFFIHQFNTLHSKLWHSKLSKMSWRKIKLMVWVSVHNSCFKSTRNKKRKFRKIFLKCFCKTNIFWMNSVILISQVIIKKKKKSKQRKKERKKSFLYIFHNAFRKISIIFSKISSHTEWTYLYH